MPQFKFKNISELSDIAQYLLKDFPDNKIFAINGNMGVGKTIFIAEICKQLQVVDIVTSPSFSIVNEYKRNNGEKIFHFDAYRIKDIKEFYDIGYEYYFFSGYYNFIEWADKIRELLPDNCVYIELTEYKNIRTIKF